MEHFETLRQTRDGRLLDVSITISPIRDAAGKVVGMSKVARDVTGRKRAEAALRALAARQEAVLAAVPDIIAEVDANKVYTWMNRAGFEFFGDDALGQEAAFLTSKGSKRPTVPFNRCSAAIPTPSTWKAGSAGGTARNVCWPGGVACSKMRRETSPAPCPQPATSPTASGWKRRCKRARPDTARFLTKAPMAS